MFLTAENHYSLAEELGDLAQASYEEGEYGDELMEASEYHFDMVED